MLEWPHSIGGVLNGGVVTRSEYLVSILERTAKSLQQWHGLSGCSSYVLLRQEMVSLSGCKELSSLSSSHNRRLSPPHETIRHCCSLTTTVPLSLDLEIIVVTDPNLDEILSRDAQRVSPNARPYCHATGPSARRLLPQLLRTKQHLREQTQRNLRLVRHSRYHFFRCYRYDRLVAN